MGNFDRNFDRRRSGRSRGRDSGGFGRGRSDGFGRRGRNRPSGRREMHSGICDKCGKDCEVPFKPTQGKPLYCDDCFKDKSREAGSRSEFGKQSGKPYNENFDQINKKLDRILNILGAAKEPVEEKPEFKKPKKIEEEQPELEYAKSLGGKLKRRKAKKKKS